MNFKSFLNSFKRGAKEIALNNNTTSKKRRSITNKLKGNEYSFKVKLGIEELQEAIQLAEGIPSNRSYLYSIYKQAKNDAHAKSQIRVALNEILSSKFEVEGIKEDNIFKSNWFNSFVKYVFEAELFGHSLIEVVSHNEQVTITLIPREHVRPSTGELLIKQDDQKGILYRNKLDSLNLIEVGDNNELGTLEIISKQVIYKEYARGDWSEHSEKYGMPLAVLKTDDQDEISLHKKENFLANFGSSGYAIIDKDEDIQVVESKGNSSHNIYKENIELSNTEISKVINGQTGTSDEKSFVGASEVHERILNSFTRARLTNIQFIINDYLIPLLSRQGIINEKCRFNYTELLHDNINTKEDENLAPTKEKVKSKGETPLKKKTPKPLQGLNFSLGTELDNLYNILNEKLGDYDENDLFNQTEISNLFDTAVKEIYQERDFNINSNGNNSLYNANYLPLDNAIDKTFETRGIKQTVNHELIHQLKTNASVFSTFKAYHQGREIAEQLLDENNKPRLFRDFEKAVKPIYKKYNKDWARTEYRTAMKRARTFTQFDRFNKNKDLYPNLEWMPSVSKIKRDSHKALYGTILPVDDPFWNTNFPGNLWNCKCSLRQTIKEPTNKPRPRDIPKPHKGLGGNVKKELFSNDHPYFEKVNKNLTLELRDKGKKLFTNEGRKNIIDKVKKFDADKRTLNVNLNGKKLDIKITNQNIRNISYKNYIEVEQAELKNDALKNLFKTNLRYFKSEPDRMIKDKKTGEMIQKHPNCKMWHYYKFNFKGNNMKLNIMETKEGSSFIPYEIQKV